MIAGHGLAESDLPRLLHHVDVAWASVPADHPLAAERDDMLASRRALAADPDAARWREPIDSPVGPLPRVAALHATSYVIASQLHAEGTADPELLEIGVAALADSIGALATRGGITAHVTLATQTSDWTVRADATGWHTTAAAPPASARVAAPAGVLLDIASGRASDVPGLLRRGEISVSDPAGLLPVAQVLATTGGIPGGPALRSGLAMLRVTGSVFSRLRWGR
jgi:hypothetical protein